MIQPPLPATTAGLLLALGCFVTATICGHKYLTKEGAPLPIAWSIAIGGLTFQVVHLIEHLLQLGVWATDPGQRPWLSAWAGGTADGLQYFCSLIPAGGSTTIGVEMLHLTGNVIFLGALASWQLAIRQSAHLTPLKTLNTAEKIQIFHVAEHALLVVTLLVFGRANGLSTGFGLLGGTALTASRVIFHFAINAFATTYAVRAARTEYRRQSALWTEAIQHATRVSSHAEELGG